MVAQELAEALDAAATGRGRNEAHILCFADFGSGAEGFCAGLGERKAGEVAAA
jgi:hypothetical protein